MFPFCFEWESNPDHLIFLGLLYVALAIIASGLTFSLIKTWIDLSQEEESPEVPEKISYRTRYSDY